MKNLHPLKVTESIRDSYLRYLRTIYPLQRKDLRKAFATVLEAPDALIKGPLLETTPPYKTGSSISGLVEENLLSPAFKILCSENGLPYERPLYKHQEQAARKIVKGNRNIVVATGTGSGKTESFLIPVLNHLLREHQEGTLTQPGVRALLLYPMNALVNDQLKRLRRILASFSHITFGRYTGETPVSNEQAEARFREQFPKEPRISNELLSRDQMRQNPPHLLITNYAMLEYLLLRPEDNVFFDCEPSRWRFLILDEAHIYDGALGIEIAMLIRRLKDRVVRSESGKLQCIATSATLGRGRDDFPNAVEFAQNLFDEPFAWNPDNEAFQDVVEATRMSAVVNREIWGEGSPILYSDLILEIELSSEHHSINTSAFGTEQTTLSSHRNESDDSFKRLLIALKTHISAKQLEHLNTLIEEKMRAGLKLNEIRSFLLHELLAHDKRLHLLREQLSEGPKFFSDLAQIIFSDIDNPKEALVNLVNLAVQARKDPQSESLLPARYHVFAKALEGAFVCLNESGHDGRGAWLTLKRHECCPTCQSPVYEIAICRDCGAIYIVANKEKLASDESFHLKQIPVLSSEDVLGRSYFLMGDTISSPDEDQEIWADEELENVEHHYLCTQCGKVESDPHTPCSCSSNTKSMHLQELKVLKGKPASSCIACGTRSNGSLIYRFLTGRDAPVSVLATALYQELPPSNIETPHVLPGHGRKLLIFSDSRQDAAFFAPYLNRTYRRLLQRRLILKTLLKHEDAAKGSLRLQDLMQPLLHESEDADLFTHRESIVERKKTVWKWLMQELIAPDRRQSLEGLGLLSFRLVKPEYWKPPSPLLNPPWSLSQDQAWQLVAILLDSLRHQSIVVFPNEVDPRDDEFKPRNRALYIRSEQSDRKAGIISWLPTRGINRRLSYLERLLEKIDPSLPAEKRREESLNALIGIWNNISTSPDWRDHLPSRHVGTHGIAHQLNFQFWEILPKKTQPLFVCTKCGTITPYNLHSTCPNHACPGQLSEFESNEKADEHYRVLYENMLPVSLSAEEHTAQWNNNEASRVQERFVKGELNVLSCSTTFELGVDVGDLQSVMLRNVPPSTANYVQRAGRAGRRTDSAAFVLTYAQRRSHDLTYYAMPEQMVSGHIHTPRIVLQNEKIVRRHMQAVLISTFLRRIFQDRNINYRKVGEFFETTSDSEISGAAHLRTYALTKPSEVKEVLKRIVPRFPSDEIGLDNWTWLETEDDDGVLDLLERASAEIIDDLLAFEALQEQTIKDKNFRLADRFYKVAQTIRSRSLLSFMASRNLLPKYGFPTDIVALKTDHLADIDAGRIQLERDLRIAIGEYAPGSEIVAAGHLWKGGGLYKLPNKEWPQYEYAVCRSCNRFHRSVSILPENCEGCGEKLKAGYPRKWGTFLIPEFGFLAARESSAAGEVPPNRGYSSRVYFAEYAPPSLIDRSTEPEFEVTDELPDSNVMIRRRYSRFGKLVVLNAGPNQSGFRICHSCGYAVPAQAGKNKTIREHRNPRSGRTCNGHLSNSDLGHEFLTDVVEIELSGTGGPKELDEWVSLLYSLLEGASLELGIKRDDLDGTLRWNSSTMGPSLILFDNVPGGAGHVRRVSENLAQVFLSARKIVNRDCCGPETSCYECLRNYRNQFFHDQLKRGVAMKLLNQMCGLLEGIELTHP